MEALAIQKTLSAETGVQEKREKAQEKRGKSTEK